MGHHSNPVKFSKRPISWLALAFLSVGVFSTVCAALPSQNPTQRVEDLTPEVDPAIRYSDSKGLADPITELQKKINSGKIKLSYNPRNGYLESVLRELKIPLSSQLLIFSKTSCQAPFTSPSTPRAIYFDDKAYVGFAQGDKVLDFVSIDPKKGVIFFTLQQDPKKPVLFKREIKDCVACHSGDETIFIPGMLIRSVRSFSDGRIQSSVQDFVNGHNSPLSDRWGGWYVTGKHGEDRHLGNGFYGETEPTDEVMKANSNITDLRDKFDTKKYPVADSDAVALLVLDHSVRMQNYMIVAQYETVTAQSERKNPKIKLVDNSRWRIKNSGEALLAYMLYRDEGALRGPISGTSSFTDDFSKRGPRDRKGRSLFEFDLNKRVFKYPCSFLIYSKSFEALPKEMKDYVWKRLSEILTGQEKSRLYAKLTAADQLAVKEILLDTKPEFRAWWTANIKS
jgi:hypothetical protein